MGKNQRAPPPAPVKKLRKQTIEGLRILNQRYNLRTTQLRSEILAAERKYYSLLADATLAEVAMESLKANLQFLQQCRAETTHVDVNDEDDEEEEEELESGQNLLYIPDTP